jgi:hypothetical protein
LKLATNVGQFSKEKFGQIHASLTQGSQKIQGTGQFPYLGKCNLQNLKDPVQEPRNENCRVVFKIR